MSGKLTEYDLASSIAGTDFIDASINVNGVWVSQKVPVSMIASLVTGQNLGSSDLTSSDSIRTFRLKGNKETDILRFVNLDDSEILKLDGFGAVFVNDLGGSGDRNVIVDDNGRLKAVNISNNISRNIYNSSDTVGSNRIVTLTDKLTFQDGEVEIQGSGVTAGTTAFKITDGNDEEYFRVKDNRFVGIGLGADSPTGQESLKVLAKGTTTNDHALYIGNGTDSLIARWHGDRTMFLANTLNIGTYNPNLTDFAININNNIFSKGININNSYSSGKNYGATLRAYGTNAWDNIALNLNASNLGGGNAYALLTTAGNVGIGTSTPTHLLEVNGSFSTNSKVIHNSEIINTTTTLDDESHIIFLEDGTYTITLPPAEDGREIKIVNKESIVRVVTIDVAEGLVNGSANITLPNTIVNKIQTAYSDGTNWYID